MKAVLFVCVGNACRSQMAEGFARAHGPKELVVYSAGSRPAGFVASEAVVGMREKGIDISRQFSKGLSALLMIEFDAVVTMGCSEDACPMIRAKKRIDWKIPDPIGLGIDYFRRVRDDLEQKVKDLLRSLR